MIAVWQRKRPNCCGKAGLFFGLLFCTDCGSCKKRTADCTAHFTRTDLLTAGVTGNLQKATGYAARHEARFMKLLMAQNEDGGKRKDTARRRELEAAQKRIGELSGIFKRPYEDSVSWSAVPPLSDRAHSKTALPKQRSTAHSRTT